MVMRNWPKHAKSYTGPMNTKPSRQQNRRITNLEEAKAVATEKTQLRWKKQAVLKAKKRVKVKVVSKRFPGEPFYDKKGRLAPLWRV